MRPSVAISAARAEESCRNLIVPIDYKTLNIDETFRRPQRHFCNCWRKNTLAQTRSVLYKGELLSPSTISTQNAVTLIDLTLQTELS